MYSRILIGLAFLMIATSCGSGSGSDATVSTIVILETTKGKITIELYPQSAPKAVENFQTHVRNGYYNGITFHRVISGFMIQSGDPSGTGYGGESIWVAPFVDEIDPTLTHARGVISMAHAAPDLNGSQFFIVQAAAGTPWLDGLHPIFGRVTDGMDVVDAIAAVETGARDKPLVDVTITSATLGN